jgi:aryl-alcohol dehydrogenase-like predicted oxidoreductase
MKYTLLGRTGVTVSRLCLGCMSFGNPAWRSWMLPEADALPFFKLAIENGINFFDTADMYSKGVSEEITGKALRQFANLEECVIATKVHFPLSAGPNMAGLSRKHIQQGCEASLRRLGIETIDLYQLHRLDPKTPMEETLAALDLLMRQGKVRYVGCSSTQAWRFAQALALSDRHGWCRFVSMQNHYNLIYREEEREMIPLCQAEGIAVIPWSPLARGLLAGTRKTPEDTTSTKRAETDDYARQLYDQPGDAAVVDAVQKVAARRGAEPAQIALAWLLARPGVTAPIIGSTKIDHLETAIAALEIELSKEEISELESPYQPHPVRGFQ